MAKDRYYEWARLRAAVFRRSRGNVLTSAHQPDADTLARLAAAVARLIPDRRDPERFHVDKAEIAAELRRLAREMARAA